MSAMFWSLLFIFFFLLFTLLFVIFYYGFTSVILFGREGKSNKFSLFF